MTTAPLRPVKRVWLARMSCQQGEEPFIAYRYTSTKPINWGYDEEECVQAYEDGDEVYIDVTVKEYEDGEIEAYTVGMEGFDP